MGTQNHCSSEVYVNGDVEISTCMDINKENWDQRFRESMDTVETETQKSDTEEIDTVNPHIIAAQQFIVSQ